MKDLKRYKQDHLIEYINELNDIEKDRLISDIEGIDFDLIGKIMTTEDVVEVAEQVVEPLIATSLNEHDSQKCFELGLESIRSGEVAVVLMAGGQGTRLGHKGPKGTFDIGLPSKKSLFHLQCDKLMSLHKLTGTYIKWYIMTSEDNHQESIDHFEAHDYFGYSRNHVIFFKQDRLPLVLEDGSIALKSQYEINLAANGNGGVFSSLNSNDLLDEMTSDGVKWVFLYGVDNAIARVADPTFIGFAINSGQSIASKSVDKAYPEEKVGVICYRNEHPDIVEYSELEDDLRYATDTSDNLLYRNANILSHVFSLDFLVDSVNRNIPYHKAHKKVDYMSEGSLCEAKVPNGYKFELFIFDMFKFSNDMAVLSVNRDEEFSPVKNKTGHDSPETAKKMILDLHHNWLEKAGFDTAVGIEVDTKFSYAGENLSNQKLQDITIG